MTDPLSISASAAGLTSLGITVIQALVDFYKASKNRESELAGITGRLESLVETFEQLQKALSGRAFQTDQRSLVRSIEKSITSCEELVRELQDECQKFEETSSKEIKASIKLLGRRATYPFRQSTLQKLDEDISEIRGNLSIALDALQLNSTYNIQSDLADFKALMELVRSNQISSDLCDWLCAPDSTVEHNKACTKKHPGTGTWLVKSPEFLVWLAKENSILWLNGFAGTGKSILCSTIISSVLRHRGGDCGIGIAFFYFTFDNTSKQDASSMIRALLLQLSNQLKEGPKDLIRLRDSYKSGVPPSLILLDYLRRLIQRFRQVYIFLDALDESPPNGAREHVLDVLETMQNWGEPKLHLFITSRDEPDIQESLGFLPTQNIVMRNAGIDKDIADFISGRLDQDRRLRKFLPYRSKIQERLTKDAKGVFRWVECQLQSLQSCPRSEDHLDQVLGLLPQSLDETYERMLCNIKENLADDARRILTLLCFAPRPLTVPELLEGVAINIKGSNGLNRKRRLQDFDDIRNICPGFVDVNSNADSNDVILDDDSGDTNSDGDSDDTFFGNSKSGVLHLDESRSTVRLAHFSIQEYLQSERIRKQKAALYHLNSSTAYTEIAAMCLVYLLEDGLSSSDLGTSLFKEYPFAHFAARYWYVCYRDVGDTNSELEDLIMRLFQCWRSFTSWVNLDDLDRGWIATDFNHRRDEITIQIYYASLLGLDQILAKLLLDEGQAVTESKRDLTRRSTSNLFQKINVIPIGRYGHPLIAASVQGHGKVVRLLIKAGAETNPGEFYGNPLISASRRGHKEVMQILISAGADVNARNGQALEVASSSGREEVMQILISAGADVNAQNGQALQDASSSGRREIMQLLINAGADVNAREGMALQEASWRGHTEAVQLLLDAGADVNAQDGEALQEASRKGHTEVMQLLISAGADINARKGMALQQASRRGHTEMVQLLLDAGADVNTRGFSVTALKEAFYRGHKEVVQLLLDAGAVDEDTSFRDESSTHFK